MPLKFKLLDGKDRVIPFTCRQEHCKDWIENVTLQNCVCILDNPATFVNNTNMLRRAALACPFVTKPIVRMNNSDKRFVLYYTYTKRYTTVTGKGARCEAPVCLTLAIRQAFPNKAGVPYK